MVHLYYDSCLSVIVNVSKLDVSKELLCEACGYSKSFRCSALFSAPHAVNIESKTGAFIFMNGQLEGVQKYWMSTLFSGVICVLSYRPGVDLSKPIRILLPTCWHCFVCAASIHIILKSKAFLRFHCSVQILLAYLLLLFYQSLKRIYHLISESTFCYCSHFSVSSTSSSLPL